MPTRMIRTEKDIETCALIFHQRRHIAQFLSGHSRLDSFGTLDRMFTSHQKRFGEPRLYAIVIMTVPADDSSDRASANPSRPNSL